MSKSWPGLKIPEPRRPTLQTLVFSHRMPIERRKTLRAHPSPIHRKRDDHEYNEDQVIQRHVACVSECTDEMDD